MFNALVLENERMQKDQFFEFHPQSPLTPDQKFNFDGLDYFPPNEALYLLIEPEEFDEKEEVEIQTTTGDTRYFERWGKIKFAVGEETAELTLFHNPDQGHFFLPFKDATSGPESYGAGRYMDPQRLADGRFLIDFNHAYSPYCAYNSRWSCPLTPAENILKVRIEAGEKKPSAEWAESY